MSLATLERKIIDELRIVAKNPKIRKKDLMEWSTSQMNPHEGETYFFLPKLKLHVCVILPLAKTPKKK
jgi:hypothetical protein